MAIDLKALDKRIKKLQRLREFAKELDGDPDFIELLAEFASKNGNRPRPAPDAVATKVRENRSTRPRGYFVEAVQGVIANLKPEFTSKDIQERLRSQGIDILAANPNIAINEALRTLEKRRLVVKTGKRHGGVQIIWKRSLPVSAVESRTA